MALIDNTFELKKPAAPTSPNADTATMVPSAQQQTPSTAAPTLSATQPAAPSAQSTTTSAAAQPVAPASVTPGGTTAPNSQSVGYTASTYDPTVRSVDQETETVAGQLRRVLSEDSPVLQQAKARAMQQANARGLSNSSIASTGALDSVISRALDIATPDAGTYTAAARDNQQYQNQAGQFNAQNLSEASRFNASSENEFRGRDQAGRIESGHIGQRGAIESGLLTQRGDIESRQIGERAQVEKDLNAQRGDIESRQIAEKAQIEKDIAAQQQNFKQENLKLESYLDTSQKERLMAIEQNYKQITNGSQEASQILQEMHARIGQVLADANIPIESKQALIDKLIEAGTKSAQLTGSVYGVDLSDIFD